MLLFGNKKKEETKGKSCCCGGGCDAKSMEAAEQEKKQGGIKVLGGGCAKCHALMDNTKTALAELGRDDAVELITDFSVIAAYGIMSTPALVINEKVVSYGKVLTKDEVLHILEA